MERLRDLERPAVVVSVIGSSAGHLAVTENGGLSEDALFLSSLKILMTYYGILAKS